MESERITFNLNSVQGGKYQSVHRRLHANRFTNP
jgi:hypothetical protein